MSNMCNRISGFSTMSVSLRVILILAFLLEVEPHTGFCVGKQCFAVHEDTADFSAANEACKASQGHLLTVRTNASNSTISALLTNFTGDFWIGLHGFCSSASALKGYKWITGQEEADFGNWNNDDAVCPKSEQCVTVSTTNLKWRGRPCTDKVAGFLCEYAFDTGCEQLQLEGHSQILTYETPYGFEAPDLEHLPMGSLAKLSNGEKYVCGDSWVKSPWSCEVLNGGCQHRCNSVTGQPTCTCPPGFMVDVSGWSCIKVADDPCAGAGCQHECLPQSGTFVCLCHQGFSLDADGKSCKDIDECTDKRICAGPHARCENTIGSFKCDCEVGFEMQKGFCVDINECFRGPCEHDCHNKDGSYTCSCFKGYKISDENKHRCELHCPYEECPAYCDPNDIFLCYCPEGFVIDKRSNGDSACVDIDECEMGQCDQHCENSFGGYTCSCGEGYELQDEYRCISMFGSEITTLPGLITTTITYTTESPTTVTASGLLGIIVCIVCVLLALVLLAHHFLRRRSEHSLLDARKSYDLHGLQQITTEHYKPNMSDIESKGER